jgi:hypothetical protein
MAFVLETNAPSLSLLQKKDLKLLKTTLLHGLQNKYVYIPRFRVRIGVLFGEAVDNT